MLRKFVVWVFFSLITITILTACNPDNTVKEASNFATQFKKAQMQVTDYHTVSSKANTEKLKNYLTDPAWNDLQQNRTMQLLLQIAKKRQMNIVLTKITFNKATLHKKIKTVDLDYSLELMLQKGQDNPEKKVNVNGQLTVTKEQEGWKISRDWFEKDIWSKLLH